MRFILILLALVFVSCADQETEEFIDLAADNQELPHEPGTETPTTPPSIDDEGGVEEPVEAPSPSCIKGLGIYDAIVAEFENSEFLTMACKKATNSQIKEVKKGNKKFDAFLTRCYDETDNSCWCDQLVRPNPQSINTFYCTYPQTMLHRLIHPDEDTWKYAIETVKIIKDLEAKNIEVKIIYNWWRPEPYNKNVGGSPTRHPFGTAIDVRFGTKNDQNKAHKELCKMRKKGRIRALGYYGSPSLHLGVGDRRANTWGKSCP